MERVQTLTSKSLVTAVLAFLLCSCSTKIKPEQLEELKSNEEFDQVIKVERIPDTPKPLKEEQISKKKEDRSHSAKKKKQKKDQLKKTGLENQEVKEVKALEKHLPEIEDSEGFNGRRPIFDPFKVGEKATMTAAFTGIPAGTVEFMVKPFLEVNGERSYNFLARATTNSFFSFFYKVEDWVETYVRYSDWLPLSFSMHVRESKQFRESRTYFDWDNLKGKFWEKKIKRGKKREKKIVWDILPYSQNVFSAFYYLRLFKYKPGKRFKFRVADDGKNLIVQIDCIKKEKIDIGTGEVEAYLSKVKFEYNGVFKQVGDILLWITADQYQDIARIEAKIKLGTISLTLDKVER